MGSKYFHTEILENLIRSEKTVSPEAKGILSSKSVPVANV